MLAVCLCFGCNWRNSYVPVVVDIEQPVFKSRGADQATSFRSLLRMDTNGDGFINAADRYPSVSFNSLKDIVKSYVEYLNVDYARDRRYGLFLEKDLNGNNMIDAFEEEFERSKKVGSYEQALLMLTGYRNRNMITPERHLSARYSLACYFGRPGDSKALFRQIAPLVTVGNREGKMSRSLLSDTLRAKFYPLLYTEKDSLKTVMENKQIFPDCFADKTFMVTFITKLTYEVFLKIELIDKNANKEKENLMNLVDRFDLIYSQVTDLDGFSSSVADRVAAYRTRLSAFKKKNGLKIDSYADAVSFLKKYIGDNGLASPDDAHLLVVALLKNEISNKKPYQESLSLFSPDTVFRKKYGVCCDQSPAMLALLTDVAGGSLDGVLYIWKRRYFFEHVSMIYRNNDNRFYILDNYGVNSASFASRDEAIGYHCAVTEKYSPATLSRNRRSGNTSWREIEAGSARSIASTDGSVSLFFSDDIRCE